MTQTVKYEIVLNRICITVCPHTGILIGTANCVDCKAFVEQNTDKKTVLCKHKS